MLKCGQCGQEHHHTLQFCPVTGNVLAPERLLPEGSILEGKYRVGKVLGAGGMGAVFAATHTMLNKAMAIKVMVPDMSADRELAARLVREARAASATGHRNVANVTDMGWTDDGALFVVMEFLNGLTLQQLIMRDGPLSPARVIKLSAQILSGLQAVHDLNIIHRDLKPENIMVVGAHDNEEVKILDFGISKIVGDEGPALNLTASGFVMGTPQYMAPEQARGADDLDHRADIYAAGAIVYTALTKRRPHTANNYNAMIAQILAGNIVPPSKICSMVPAALDAVVLKALSLKPSERYEDATAFKRALEAVSLEVHFGVSALSSIVAPTGDPSTQYDFSADQLVSLAEVGGRDRGGLGEVENAEGERVPLDLTQAPLPLLELSSPDDTPKYLEVSPTRLRKKPAGGDGEDRSASVGDTDFDVDQNAAFYPDTPLIEASGELELDHSYTPPPVAEPGTAAAGETIFRPAEKSSGGSARKLFFLLLVIGGLAVGAGLYWDELRGLFQGPDSPIAQEKVMILIVSKPKQVDVFVDGKLREGNPIELLRSNRTHQFLFQAEGYSSKTLDVIPNRTHSLNVNLKR